MKKCLVCSTFEGGYQPVTALSAASALKQNNIDVGFIDTYVQGAELAVQEAKSYEFAAISVPMFDSLRTGIELARRIRVVNPDAKIIFFGQYASINVERLTGRYADYTIAGEWEKALIDIVTENSESLHSVVDVVRLINGDFPPVRPSVDRNSFFKLDRSLGPTLSKYPQPQLERLLGRSAVVGGIEATRGCHHKCTYCSVYAAYDGKVLIAPEEYLIADVNTLIEQGMTHLTFIDADFFNTKRKGLDLIRKLHSLHPLLTYDFTARVDHILENKAAIEEMRSYGLALITSALEFPKQEVLDQVYKEMTMEMTMEAIYFLQSINVKLNPTFIMFNPWIKLEDLAIFHNFIEAAGLVDNVDPVQFETRLHLYKGSPLLSNESIKKLDLIESEFHFDWKHPDERVDELFLSMVKPLPEGEFKRCCLKC